MYQMTAIAKVYSPHGATYMNIYVSTYFTHDTYIIWKREIEYWLCID